MNRIIRMRRYNPKSPTRFDVLFPQTITTNVLRSNDGGPLESYLDCYDRHLENDVVHINRALSDGTARALFVRFKNTMLVDNFPLLLTLHTDLECAPTLTFNDGEEHEIISASGDTIPGGQKEGTVIFLVWKERLQKWVLLSSDNFTDVTKVVLPVDNEYVYEALSDGESTFVIPGFNRKSDKLIVNYEQTILRQGIDYDFDYRVNDVIELKEGITLDKGERLYFTITTYITTAKRGNMKYDLVTRDYPVEITEDGMRDIPIPADAKANSAHSIVVNYNQTILRNGIDYTMADDKSKITLTFDPYIDIGNQIVFTITYFEEVNGEVVPNNWGATGNYRYALNVIHTSYKATENGVRVIPIPNYNPRRDHISVIRDNHLLIYDVDYTIDEIGNVVLLDEKALNINDEIFFTILQGAMMDVPNFNVIQAEGQDGQHLLLNMSQSLLVDYYTLLVRLKHDLVSAPTAKCIDGPAIPICDCYGTPIPGGFKAGAYLWLCYSEPENVWYALSYSQYDISQFIPDHKVASGIANFSGQPTVPGNIRETVIQHNLGVKPERIDIVPCEPPTVRADGTLSIIGDIWSYADETNLYVGNSGDSTSKFSWTVSSEDKTTDLREYIVQEIEKIKNQPGKIVTKLSTFTATEDHTRIIRNINNFVGGVDKLIVNYNQTVLRNGTDYIIHSKYNGIELIGFELDKDEILQFTILKQISE